MDKPLTLEGEYYQTAIIVGTGNDSVISIEADNVAISMLRITNGSRNWPYAGIRIRGNGTHINKNNITDNYHGILIDKNTSEHTIEKNEIFSNMDVGIYLLHSNNNSIMNNICNMNWNGIFIMGSSDNDITGNSCNGNTHNGIGVDSYSIRNSIVENQCDNNGYAGIRLHLSNHTILKDNSCHNNDRGYFLSSSDYTNFRENWAENNVFGCQISNSCHNQFKENSIISNEKGFVIWENGDASSNNTIQHNNI